MITLQEIFDHLTYGDLYQVYDGGGDYDECGQGDLGVRPESRIRLIQHINLAMTNIFTRFPMEDKGLDIGMIGGKTIYELDSKYALSNTVSMEDKYILDTVQEPFMDDVLRINSVFDMYGDSIPLNDENDPESVFTPKHNTIQIPNPINGEVLSFIYRVKPIKIDVNTKDPSIVKLDIPSYLIEPLLCYVAYRVHSSRPSAESQQLSNNCLMRYQMLCAELSAKNVMHTDVRYMDNKFYERGFV